MIFINKPSESPSKLLKYHEYLEDAIKKYSGINNIPDNERKKLMNNYNHKEIKQVLFSCSHNKCSYCETIPYESYLEVDHWAPKKLYPELSLEWDNLLPSCRKCNNYKRDYDSIKEPIINPCKIDPEPYFVYEHLAIKPAPNAPDPSLALKTIQVCNLNRRSLAEARAKLLIDLNDFEQNLNNSIDDLNEFTTLRKKMNRIFKLQEALEIIENFTKAEKNYSGLSRKFIKKSKIFQYTENYIKEFQKEHPEQF